MKEPRSLLDVSPVLSMISMRTVGDAAAAVPVARAIGAAGLPLVQVALDAPGALAAVERISAEAPEIIVGAGAVSDVAEPALARAAGAEFLTSTTSGSALRTAMRASELPHLPAATNAREVMELLDDGYTDMVLHPAASAAGPRRLKALAAFVPAARFCAAGGVGAADLSRYLAAPNVGCVVADWFAPADAVARRDWDRIRRLAGVALTLSTPTVTAVRAL